MNAVVTGYRSMSIVLSLNWDRVIYLATLALALMAGAYVGSLL